MEPFTAAATVISVLDVSIRTISALVSYTRNTQGASKEQKLLADESAVLLDILKVLNERAKSTAPGSAWFEERKGLTWQFKKALDELAAGLHLDPSTGSIKKESRLRTMRTAATWAFTKSDTYAILERISRLQQSSNTLMMHDQRFVPILTIGNSG
jgi:hypothetical protein